MTPSVSVERTIAASPDAVWALISDVTRMGEWSPETTACEWLGGASRPATGAKFKGRNSSGTKSWSTVCEVTECEPGRTFSFLVKGGPFPVATWEYRIDPADDGCRVVEEWTDRRNLFLRKTSKLVSGVDDRAAHNRTGMETTLAQLAAVAER